MGFEGGNTRKRSTAEANWVSIINAKNDLDSSCFEKIQPDRKLCRAECSKSAFMSRIPACESTDISYQLRTPTFVAPSREIPITGLVLSHHYALPRASDHFQKVPIVDQGD